ncbi:hypothetical protein like AT5G65005 [Hibiscus trionum]|uniref:RNase H type-1 domain-containing protein n=1 Tax=Hibiscus trionum TaxID=183268 RepID=A0A9W7JJD6_HIBTR|nr:hypothetical protein like AT5G65005 [Hibiscus trionum]
MPESVWWSCPSTCVVSRRPKKVRAGLVWQPPVAGTLKFNVDGSARGKPGPAGVREVMRDADSRILALFSGPVGCLDSNVAEVKAIELAVQVVAEGVWRERCVVIESDSQVALSWVTGLAKRPWRLWDSFASIDQACQTISEIHFHYTPREANGFADVLAKEGVDRSSLFLACI